MKKVVVHILLFILGIFQLYSQDIVSLESGIVEIENSKGAKPIYYRPLNVFDNPYLFINTFDVKTIPVEFYTEKEKEIQKNLNEQEEGVVTFSTNQAIYERDIDNEEITPYTWKWVHLQVKEQDGSYTNIHLRRPNWWFLQNNATKEGDKVHISIPQIGVDEEVAIIKIYPNSLDTRFWDEKKEGIHITRPITGKIEHYVNNVVDIAFDDRSKPISVTTNHLLWSADRNDWIQVENLNIGEKLTTKNGEVVLKTKVKKDNWHIVYDLEVYRDHNFLVSDQYILAHNGCNDLPKKKHYSAGFYNGKKPKYTNPGHHDKKSANFRGGGAKTELIPDNAEELYKKAVPGLRELNTKQGIPSTWYSIDNKGKIHQFQVDHNGNAHWAGSENGARGIQIDNETRKRLQQLYKDRMRKTP